MATTNGSRKSTSSSGSAKKSGSTAKKPAASAKGSTRAAKNAPKPVRREVGAAVCAFLAILSFIGYFDVDGWFIDIFCGFIKGLLGWGFYLFPPALLLAAMLSGIAAISLMKLITKKSKFGWFAYYCWGAGVLTIILSLIF